MSQQDRNKELLGEEEAPEVALDEITIQEMQAQEAGPFRNADVMADAAAAHFGDGGFDMFRGALHLEAAAFDQPRGMTYRGFIGGFEPEDFTRGIAIHDGNVHMGWGSDVFDQGPEHFRNVEVGRPEYFGNAEVGVRRDQKGPALNNQDIVIVEEDVVIIDDDAPSVLTPTLFPLNPIGSHFFTAHPLDAIVSAVEDLTKRCRIARFVPSECKWFCTAVTSSSAVEFTVRVHRLPRYHEKAGQHGVIFNRSQGDREPFFEFFLDAEAQLSSDEVKRPMLPRFPAALATPAVEDDSVISGDSPITLASVRRVVLSNIASPHSSTASVSRGVAMLGDMLSSPSASALTYEERIEVVSSLLPVVRSPDSTCSARIHAVCALSNLLAASNDQTKALVLNDAEFVNSLRGYSQPGDALFGFESVLQSESAKLSGLCMI